MKAPKFENMPGFIPQENGLFEVKLISTIEGLVFVNLECAGLRLPFSGSRSGTVISNLQWREQFDVDTNCNWKTIGELSSHSMDTIADHWKQLSFPDTIAAQAESGAGLCGGTSKSRHAFSVH